MSESPDAVGPPLPASEDAAAVGRIRRWNRFYKIAVIWLVGWVGLIVEKIVNLDSVMDGLRAGFTRGAFVALAILVITLPLGWLGSRIGSWEKWRRYRTWFTFAVPLLYVLAGVAGALKDRYFPQEEFQRITGVEYPRDARMERCVYNDGLFGRSYVYEIRCPVEETERMIHEMKLREVIAPAGMVVAGTTSKGWIMTEAWQREVSIHGIGIKLETDASRTTLVIYCNPAF